MSKMVTVSDACRELGIARSTLDRRLKRLGIKARSIGIDKRERYITDKEVSDIRSAYAAIDERKQSATGANQKRNISAAQLEDKVAALEEEIERLKQGRMSRLSVDAPQGESDGVEQQNISAYRPRAPRTTTNSIQGNAAPPLPEGWESLKGFCESHGIAPTTVRHAIAASRLPQSHRGRWLQGRAIVLNALDEDMQAKILALYGHKNNEAPTERIPLADTNDKDIIPG